MNVCFLAGTLGRGGAERQLCFMLRALKREGLDPRLLCLTKGEPLEKEIREMGIRVDWVGRYSNRPQRLYAIYRAVQAIKPTVIQSSHFYTNTYVGAVSKVLGIPSIGSIRNDLVNELRANPVFGKWHLKLPDHLIANSRLGRDNAVANGIAPDRLDLVPNVVEKRSLTLNGKRRGNGGFTFLFAGRLSQQKRPQMFIELAERLSANLPQEKLRFLILGDGVMRRELEAKAARLKMPASKLAFLGERSDVHAVFAESDALVLTSRFEGTPNVILEAMAHGIPVIATRVGGICDVLPETRGILVDPSDFEGLIRAAEKLVLNPELSSSLGVEGRKYVEKTHSADRLGKVLIEIYSKVVDRRT